MWFAANPNIWKCFCVQPVASFHAKAWWSTKSPCIVVLFVQMQLDPPLFSSLTQTPLFLHHLEFVRSPQLPDWSFLLRTLSLSMKMHLDIQNMLLSLNASATISPFFFKYSVFLSRAAVCSHAAIYFPLSCAVRTLQRIALCTSWCLRFSELISPGLIIHSVCFFFFFKNKIHLEATNNTYFH